MAADFVQKLQDLTAKNSEHELSIEKYLIKSEEAFFGKVRKDKLSSAASERSHQRDSVWGTPDPSIYSRPSCECIISLYVNFAQTAVFQHRWGMVSPMQTGKLL